MGVNSMGLDLEAEDVPLDKILNLSGVEKQRIWGLGVDWSLQAINAASKYAATNSTATYKITLFHESCSKRSFTLLPLNHR